MASADLVRLNLAAYKESLDYLGHTNRLKLTNDSS